MASIEERERALLAREESVAQRERDADAIEEDLDDALEQSKCTKMLSA